MEIRRTFISTTTTARSHFEDRAVQNKAKVIGEGNTVNSRDKRAWPTTKTVTVLSLVHRNHFR